MPSLSVYQVSLCRVLPTVDGGLRDERSGVLFTSRHVSKWAAQAVIDAIGPHFPAADGWQWRRERTTMWAYDPDFVEVCVGKDFLTDEERTNRR